MTNKKVLETIVDLREKIVEAINSTLKLKHFGFDPHSTWSVSDTNDLSNARTYLREADEKISSIGRRWENKKGKNNGKNKD